MNSILNSFVVHVLRDRRGKKGIFKMIVSVAAMVIVGTVLQTGFNLSTTALSGGSATVGAGEFLNFSTWNLNILPVFPVGGGGGGGKNSPPPVKAGDELKTPVVNKRQTVYEVEAVITVDADKVKFRSILTDPNKTPYPAEYEWPDMPGVMWKNPQKVAEERDEWLREIAAERDRQKAELQKQKQQSQKGPPASHGGGEGRGGRGGY